MRQLARHRVRGLTLVELLISITIGLLIVGAVLYVYLGSRGAYRTSTSTSRVQEAGRFGLDAILRDVRQAGFIGCGSRLSPATFQPQGIYQIANPPLGFTAPAQAVQGYAATTYQSGASTPWPLAPALKVQWYAGDVLVLRVAVGAPVMLARDPDPTIPAIFLGNNCGRIKTGDYLLVSSCTMATVLRVANAPDASAASCPAAPAVVAGGVEVDHGATDVNGNTVNGNAPLKLTALVPPSQPPLSLAGLPTAQAFDEVSYYVGRIPGRAPALYRYSATAATAAATVGLAEEIIDHVENMSVSYGIAPVAGGAVVYQDAATVQAANGGLGNWGNVISVRISLLAAGDELKAVDAPQSIPFGPSSGGTSATTLTAPDTRLRQVFTATAALRDRLQ